MLNRGCPHESLPVLNATPGDNFPSILVSLPLSHSPNKLSSKRRLARTHLLELLRHATQVRSQEARADAKRLDAVIMQEPVPVEHHHVERRLAALVAQVGSYVLLGPSGLRLGRPWRVEALGMSRERGQARGDEDEAGGRGLDEKRDEFGRHDVSSGDVDVVCLVEDGADVGEVVCEVVRVKSSAWTNSSSYVSNMFFNEATPLPEPREA